jgi:cytochrome b
MSTPELLSDFGAVDGGPAILAPAPTARAGARRVLVWDLPLRVFHWSLVAAVAAAVVTGELGGAWMVWHGRAGLLIVGLLVFRVVWGVVGSATSRFTHFAPSPARVVAYLRGRWRGVGHNPLGALAVFALLGLLSLQVATGLFGTDDIAFAGPLNHLVDDTLGARSTGWHRVLAYALFALLALHLLAIAFHVVVKRHRLIRPMISGVLDVDAGTPLPRPVRGGTRFGLLVAVSLAAVGVLALAGAGETPTGAAPAAAAKAAAPAPAW